MKKLLSLFMIVLACVGLFVLFSGCDLFSTQIDPDEALPHYKVHQSETPH